MCEVCKSHHGTDCCGPYHYPFRILRWVLGLLIIFIVFSVGVKIGEFKGSIEGDWGYGYGHRGMMIRYGQPNMYYGGDYFIPSQVTAPADYSSAPVAQPVKK